MDRGPSRTGGSVYFAAKLGKHCAFWEKEKDKDELGKKRKKKEASLVVDASLPNPQPECIQSTYDFYRQ